MFKIIAYTAPGYSREELNIILELLESQVIDYLHIRKPEWDYEQLENFILAVPQKYYHKLKIHSHFDLCNKYKLGGIHLNRRNPVPPENLNPSSEISISLHSFEEIITLLSSGIIPGSENYKYSYVTLSPIYDSISKKGYNSNFNLRDVEFKDKLNVIREKGLIIIALGGITPGNFKQLNEIGFGGAAILGYIWNSNLNTSEIIIQIKSNLIN